MVSKDDCWLFAGTQWTTSGYGGIYAGWDKQRRLGLYQAAHRVMYENIVGPIPEGTEIDHLCENPPCINPAHLEAVPHRLNTLRHYRNRTHCRKGHPYADGVYWMRKKSNVSVSNPTGLTRKCKSCYKKIAAPS